MLRVDVMKNPYIKSLEDILKNDKVVTEAKIDMYYDFFKALNFREFFMITKAIERLTKDLL